MAVLTRASLLCARRSWDLAVCGRRCLPNRSAVTGRVESPDAEEDVIARRLYGNPFAWGTTLIIIGTLFLLHTLLGCAVAN